MQKPFVEKNIFDSQLTNRSLLILTTITNYDWKIHCIYYRFLDRNKKKQRLAIKKQTSFRASIMFLYTLYT